MSNAKFKLNVLSGNVLKIIAAVCMLIDHIGYILFPDVIALRIIGRLSFPLFAFMIAEGCRYTKNKVRYFSFIFILAVLFQIVYYIVSKSLYLNVFITFSLSILVIFALQTFKAQLQNKDAKVLYKILSGLLFVLAVAIVYLLNLKFIIDYGFWGCMLPVFATIFHYKGENKLLQKLDCNLMHVLTFSLGLVLLCLFDSFDIIYYSLFSIPLLLLYSGKRGRLNMKYFFYIFYPLHLVILYGISMII